MLIIAAAGYGSEVDAAPLEAIEGVLAADTGIYAGIVALDLGEVDFPAGMQQVEAVLTCCRRQGLSTNWMDWPFFRDRLWPP